MLTDSEFTVKGKCVISLMLTKLDIINTFLLMKYNRTIIQMKTGRVKGYDSVCKREMCNKSHVDQIGYY